ncbi:hypothetical protein IGI04_023887 [Brassica rapa subsp. trilocularis]|uniref:Secreted protein n=1 Tax=Brassica rapa subsp. trilocularis TaxID=1813537 RepID=A0ABQ7M562_BRACM|nr:hypothetical protein IGI04_023887 [Brassica rapa subsp. trilocularis]
MLPSLVLRAATEATLVCSVSYHSRFIFLRVTAGQACVDCGFQKVGPIPSRQSAQSLTGRPADWMPKECIGTLLDAAGCSRTLQVDPLLT